MKTNVLKFTQQKFEHKNQNKRFLQMFNMQVLGYMANIKTVFHFLPNSNIGYWDRYWDRWSSRPQLSKSSDHPLTLEEEERRTNFLHSPREKSYMELGLEI